MAAILTEEEFSQHVNTKFRVNVDASQPIELDLVEVKGYVNKNKPGEQSGMERFSAFFSGPADSFLPQGSYSLEHDGMGSFDIFLVPLARNEKGCRYEAVFNYFK
jgi:hypothetical protein